MSKNQSAFKIQLENDEIFEDDENFRASLEIVGSSLPRVSIGMENVTIAILDDDSKTTIVIVEY